MTGRDLNLDQRDASALLHQLSYEAKVGAGQGSSPVRAWVVLALLSLLLQQIDKQTNRRC